MIKQGIIKTLIISYGKTISSVVITLKTSKGSKTLKLDPSIHENLTREKVF